jgi:peptidoglycan/LPS O-acetylase OafA/YrhL
MEIATMKILAVYTDFVPTDYPEMWTRISLEFSAGVFVWCWWRRGRSGRGWDLLAVFSLVAIGAVCWFVPEEESPRAYLALPFIAMFVASAASSTSSVKVVLSHPITVWLGRVSYSLYMTHYIVWRAFDKFDLTDRMSGRPLVERAGALMVVCVTVVLAAAFTYYVIEEPARRVVQRFAARSKPRPVFPGRNRMSHNLR